MTDERKPDTGDQEQANRQLDEFYSWMSDLVEDAVRRFGAENAEILLGKLVSERVAEIGLAQPLSGLEQRLKGEVDYWDKLLWRRPEDQKKRNLEDFHRLWSGAIVSKRYDKKIWQDVERQLLAAGMI
jgi:hypothetical protein